MSDISQSFAGSFQDEKEHEIVEYIRINFPGTYEFLVLKDLPNDGDRYLGGIENHLINRIKNYLKDIDIKNWKNLLKVYIQAEDFPSPYIKNIEKAMFDVEPKIYIIKNKDLNQRVLLPFISFFNLSSDPPHKFLLNHGLQNLDIKKIYYTKANLNDSKPTCISQFFGPGFVQLHKIIVREFETTDIDITNIVTFFNVNDRLNFYLHFIYFSIHVDNLSNILPDLLLEERM